MEFIKLDDALKRAFYMELCAEARWLVRVLCERVSGMLYERTAIAKQPDEVIRQALATVDPSPLLFLKAPYLLDFLDLKDNFTEKDLENAILAELERFIFGVVFEMAGEVRTTSR